MHWNDCRSQNRPCLLFMQPDKHMQPPRPHWLRMGSQLYPAPQGSVAWQFLVLAALGAWQRRV